MIFTSIVPQNSKPLKPLGVYLAERFTYYAPEQWLEKIADGKITVNGMIANTADYAPAGATITYDAGEFDEPAANLDYTIIYEDEWFLGVDKPGNLLVHRAGRSFRNNLVYQLRYVHTPPFPDIHATHRLDRDTSGVILFAKKTEARVAMGKQFETGTVDKEYLAVVCGVPSQNLKKIDIPIGKDTKSEISYKYCADTDGKDAVTLVEECTPVGQCHALLRLRPLTGRTHQIRVHCAASGYPLVGDKLYTMEEQVYMQWRDNPSAFTGVIDFSRHALHCRSIGFNHPYTNKYCTIESAMPDDMAELIKKLACSA